MSRIVSIVLFTADILEESWREEGTGLCFLLGGLVGVEFGFEKDMEARLALGAKSLLELLEAKETPLVCTCAC